MSRSRTKARHCAVQALYQWQLTGTNEAEIFAQFLAERNMAKVNVGYFRELLYGVVSSVADIDRCLSKYLDRDIDEVDDVERAVLRMGGYELIYRLEVPYRVAINEALEAAKVFGSEQGYKFVNGVLDKVAHEVRTAEVQKARI